MTRQRLLIVSALLACMALAEAHADTLARLRIDPAVLSTAAAVQEFLHAHAGYAYSDATVGDYRLLDMAHDGNLELVATIDLSGRAFFNRLLVVSEQGGGLTVQEVEVWNMDTLDGAVEDLAGDGRLELLLRQALTPYLGAHPMAAWTAVFAFTGEALTDQSAKFPVTYEARLLPQVESSLAAAQGGSRENRRRQEVLEIERDRILRLLGRPSDAGLPSALSWAASGDSVERIYAASVLAAIGGREATAAVAALGEDRDPEVARFARAARERARRR